MGGTYLRDIEEGGGRTSTFPFERWRYRHIESIGNKLILEFVDSSMSGEYRLEFDPAAERRIAPRSGRGPHRIRRKNGTGQGGSPEPGSRQSRKSLRPGCANSAISIALDTYNKILTPPAVKFKDLEAIVTSRLSYNVLPFDYRADVYKMTDRHRRCRSPYKSLTDT